MHMRMHRHMHMQCKACSRENAPFHRAIETRGLRLLTCPFTCLPASVLPRYAPSRCSAICATRSSTAVSTPSKRTTFRRTAAWRLTQAPHRAAAAVAFSC